MPEHYALINASGSITPDVTGGLQPWLPAAEYKPHSPLSLSFLPSIRSCAVISAPYISSQDEVKITVKLSPALRVPVGHWCGTNWRRWKNVTDIVNRVNWLLACSTFKTCIITKIRGATACLWRTVTLKLLNLLRTSSKNNKKLPLLPTASHQNVCKTQPSLTLTLSRSVDSLKVSLMLHLRSPLKQTNKQASPLLYIPSTPKRKSLLWGRNSSKKKHFFFNVFFLLL